MLAALRGDTSDNLAGVPGVGEKTAAKLVTPYGDLDEHLRPPRRADPEAPPEPGRARGPGPAQRQGDPARPRRPARRSSLDDLALGRWDTAEVKRVFGELEMPHACGSGWRPLMGGDAESPLPRAAGGRAGARPSTSAGWPRVPAGTADAAAAAALRP